MTVFGTSGDDTLTSTGTNATLSGGEGNDTYVFTGRWGNSLVVDNSGINTLVFGSDISQSDIQFFIPRGSNTLDLVDSRTTDTIALQGQLAGGSGVSTIQFTSAGTSIPLTTQGLVLTGGAGNDDMGGTSFNDTLHGGAGNDTLAGGAGDDVLDGGSGRNLFIATSGNDTVLSSGADTVNADGGTALVYAGGPSIEVNPGSATLIFVGGSGSDTVYGGTGTAIIYGGTGGGSFTAGTGGNSILVAATGNSTLTGAANGDVMFGSSAGGGRLVATGGSEIMVGGAGTTTMQGGSGTAVMFAGTAADVFATSASAKGNLLVVGFKQGTDKVSLVSGNANHALAGTATGAWGTTLQLKDGSQIVLFGVSSVTSATFL